MQLRLLVHVIQREIWLDSEISTEVLPFLIRTSVAILGVFKRHLVFGVTEVRVLLAFVGGAVATSTHDSGILICMLRNVPTAFLGP